MQKKIEELEMNFEQENESKWVDGASAEVLKDIHAKKASLGKIPFLEKINLEGRIQEYKDVVRDCHKNQNRILEMVRKL